MSIEKKSNETKDEYIGRCIGIEINNGMPSEQAPVFSSILYENIPKNKIKEFIVDDDNLTGVLEAISLVEEPAIEMDYIFFNQDKKLFSLNDEQRIVMGVAMAPDKLIYRNDGTMEGYYGYFTKETIKKCAYQFMKEKRNDMVTLQHEKPLDNVYVIESWIVEDPELDKSKSFGIETTTGCWMVAMKVEDEETWKQVKNGEAKGFSIEGFFGLNKKEDILDKIKDIMSSDETEVIQLQKLKEFLS